MTGFRRFAVTALGVLAAVQCRVHAQEPPARLARPVCRQSFTSRAQTLDLGDRFTVKGAGSRQIGDRTQWVWTGDDCSAWIRTSPDVDTDATGRGLVIAPAGVFDAFQRDAQGIREITISGTARHLRVDGREVIPTAADDKWLGDMALEYTRRAGLHAAERAQAILNTGGVKGLLGEIEEITSPRVRARYLVIAMPAVTTDGRSTFLAEAGRLLDRGIAWATLLDAVPASWRSDVSALKAIYTASAAIDPDEVVERILQRFPPPHPAPAEIRQLVEILIDTLQVTERRIELRALLLGVSVAGR